MFTTNDNALGSICTTNLLCSAYIDNRLEGGMRPDKKKVVDEVWDDDRVRSFLDKQPLGAETSADYSALLFAYRSMRSEDFQRFIGFYQEAGRDLDATSITGETLLQTIASHGRSDAFRQILVAAGARA